ncbi:Motility protein B [compost metagenome]
MSKKRKHEEHDEHIDESWLLPYSDLLTLLLALFIVLYAMTSVDVKKFDELSRAFNIALSSGTGVLENTAVVQIGDDSGKRKEEEGSTGDEDKKSKEEEAREEQIKKEQAELDDLKRKIDAYIEEKGLTSDLETKLNLSQLMITIRDNALFAPAQADVKPESRDLAVAIGKLLQQYPEYQVVVSGHTDTTPISTYLFRSNWDLSNMRAVRFLDILLENKELDPKRFSASGFGEYHPVADNDTVEGKAKNRRVEVSIIRNFTDAANLQQLTINNE